MSTEQTNYVYPTSGFSIFFDLWLTSVAPTGWPLNDCYYIYTWTLRSSRLREYWMAQNIAKQKNMYTLFLNSPFFYSWPTIIYMYILIYKEGQGCMSTEYNKNTHIPYFWIHYLFAWRTHLRSTNMMAVKGLLFYIYNYL